MRKSVSNKPLPRLLRSARKVNTVNCDTVAYPGLWAYCRQAFPYPVTEGLPVNHALAVEYGPSNLSEAHHTVTGSHRTFKSRLPARCIWVQGGQKAAHIVGAMAAVRCPNDALSPVAARQPGPGNDVTVYNADAGLWHTRRIWLVSPLFCGHFALASAVDCGLSAIPSIQMKNTASTAIDSIRCSSKP